MSLELERAAVADKFLDVWQDQDGPIAWTNKEFVTPEVSMFCVFNIVDRGTLRRSIGWNFYKRRMATMQIDIYTPLDFGTKRSREIVDGLEVVYEMLELPLSDGEVLIFETPSSRVLDPNVIRAGNLDDNWDRYVFEAPYHRDQHVEK